MTMPLGDIAPELVLVGGGVAVLLFALFTPRRAQPLAAALALATIVVAAGFTIDLLPRTQALTFHDTYALDGAALWAKLFLLGIAAVTVAFSAEWFRADARHGEYYTLLLFATLGAVMMAGASDLMQLILAILLSSATSFVLAAYHRNSKISGEAAIKYYLLGALTNGALLYGAALLFGLAGTTVLSELTGGLAAGPAWVGGVGFGLVALSLAFKMGAMPAHAWVPDVAQGAPAPVAAFLTTATKVGALIALARLVSILPQEIGWRPFVALLAAATMTLGNLAALWQDDLRRLLGWSAVSQTGYGLMAVVALDASDLAIPSLLSFLLAYALANLAAFGVVIELRGLSERASYAGLARVHPLLALALVLAFLSFIGIPPLAGFTAKLLLFGAAIEAGYGWLAVLAVANTVLSVAYYGRVLGPAYFEAPGGAPQPVLGRIGAVGTGMAAVGVVAAGMAAEFFLKWFGSAQLLP